MKISAWQRGSMEADGGSGRDYDMRYRTRRPESRPGPASEQGPVRVQYQVEFDGDEPSEHAEVWRLADSRRQYECSVNFDGSWDEWLDVRAWPSRY